MQPVLCLIEHDRDLGFEDLRRDLVAAVRRQTMHEERTWVRGRHEIFVDLERREHAAADVRLVLGTGFCGAYTTFSAFSFETIRLLETGRARSAVRNVLLNAAGGLLLAGAGLALGAWA